MKKLNLSLLVFVLLFQLTGCQNKAAISDTNKYPVLSVSVDAEPTKEPLFDSESTALPSENPVISSEKSDESQSNIETEKIYIGNKNTKKFHEATCETLPKEKNRINFSSRNEAIDENFKPCKKCNP